MKFYEQAMQARSHHDFDRAVYLFVLDLLHRRKFHPSGRFQPCDIVDRPLMQVYRLPQRSHVRSAQGQFHYGDRGELSESTWEDFRNVRIRTTQRRHTQEQRCKQKLHRRKNMCSFTHTHTKVYARIKASHKLCEALRARKGLAAEGELWL